ncbi:MAG: AbrB/MazE/SpoVT family DNA-binding domain-containing protein [Candidatus Kapaibacteriota bacterium]
MKFNMVVDEKALRYARRVFKVGNSNVVTIPWRLLKRLGIKTGQFVQISMIENAIIIKKIREEV